MAVAKPVSLPYELVTHILSMLSFRERAVARRVCRQWADVVHHLMSKQQELRLGSFCLMECYDPRSETRFNHEVADAHHVPDELIVDSGKCRMKANSLITFVGKYCTELMTIELGPNWNKYLIMILKSHGERIESLKTQVMDMREKHLQLLPNIQRLQCKRILYRETGNLFHICPKMKSVICTRLNYDSLYAIPDGVHVHDEEQYDRYQSFGELA